MLAVVGQNGKIYLWNLHDTKSVPVTLTNPKAQGVQAVAFSPDSSALAAGDDNGHIYLWSMGSPPAIAVTLTDPAGASVGAVAFSPSDPRLAYGDDFGNIYLWDLITDTAATRNPLEIPGSGFVDVETLAYSPDGSTLAAGASSLSSAYLWSSAHPAGPAVLPLPGSYGVCSVAFNPLGTLMVTGDHNGSTYVWRLPAGR
jgi:WD40 repeat protein